jgi:hypothetical protein
MAVDEIRVSTATARWADTQAVDRFFDSIPDADAARSRLKPGSFLQMYDAITKRDLWIARDGAIVRCVTIAGIDRETGACVRAEFDTVEGKHLDAKQVAAFLSKMMGFAIPLVN